MKFNTQQLRTRYQQYYERLISFISSKAFNAIFWALLGTGSEQLIRFASNLILTRLLFPEAFGIMAIVHAVIIGLTLLSDVGLREGVINSDRTDDPTFMRTAWTVEVVKSLLIALAAIIIAYPASQFYDEPLLFPVICIVALTVILKGFRSIALLVYDKRMDLKKQIICYLFNQIITVIVVITWASIWPTIWALVAGQVVGVMLDVLFSYKLFKGHFSKFAWDKETVISLLHFGKWILISSVLSFTTAQASPLIMGGFITMSELGKYSLAAGLAGIISLFAGTLSQRVLHPLFRESFDRETNFQTVRNMRLLFNIGLGTLCIGFALFGDSLITLLYDDRYIAAGWMLQVLALGQIGRCMSGTLMPFLLAKGDSFSQMRVSAISAALLIILVIAGGHYYGSIGVIVAYSLVGLLTHPVIMFLATRHGYNCSLNDGLVMAAGIGIITLGWILTDNALVQHLSSMDVN